MTLPIAAAPTAPSPPGTPGRLRLTAYAVAGLGLWLPTLLGLILTLVGGVLAITWIGLAVVVWSIPLLRWCANRHRAMAERILGVPVPRDHRPVPDGTHVIGRVLIWARDPMTWRELLWALVSLTLGLLLSLLTLLLLVCVVTGMLWWFGAEPIMQARARLDAAFLRYGRTERLEQRVARLTQSRAEAVDHSAAELRRLERDLHDGAQARLVALSMSLGLAEEALETDPEKARTLVRDARAISTAALGDLRSVVRGIHPPVLADRGLVGAIQALALDLPLPVDVDARLDGTPPAPVESALYFGVAECLANVVKHAGAAQAWVRLRHDDDLISASIGDDGAGGADPRAGTGMLGVARRLAAFDGSMTVSSPVGGPTLITLEVPCALSSEKTTPSSGPA